MDLNGVFINVKRSWPRNANDAYILATTQEYYRKAKQKTLKNYGLLVSYEG